ncbi:MAG: hypothetical protein QOI78_8014 [Actinomycetota bacterium]|jgi:hypothetical protein|nr:hypothetical protein [Actinomycetota bacterium]
MTEEQPPTVVFFLEEPSAEAALKALVPKIVPGVEFEFNTYTGKEELVKNLPARLRGYRACLPFLAVKIVVLVDRDDDDCVQLKQKLDDIAAAAGLRTGSGGPARNAIVLNRIVVEELEAWFLGDVPAIGRAYPRVPASLGAQSKFRDPDAIRGGTWETFERVLQKHGYHPGRLRKLAAAADIAPHMDIENNRSKSFQVFRDGLRRLVKEGN